MKVDKYDKAKHGEFILDCMSERPKKGEKMDIVAFLIWLALIVAVVVAVFGCDDAYALDASWYSVEALKRDGQWAITKGQMANGEYFSDSLMVAASRDFPLNSVVRISSGVHSTVVVVKDRINKRFKGKRIDLSPRAFKEIAGVAGLGRGIVPNVTCEVL